MSNTSDRDGSNTLPAPQQSNTEYRTPIAIGDRGVHLKTLDEMWRLANLIHKSGLAPKGFQSPEAIIVAWQYGAELGMSPMQSLHAISVINGTPRLTVDAALAVCRASGLFDESSFVEEVTDTHASCTVRRLPNGVAITRTFSIDDARRAGLIKQDSAWQKYPRRMLQLRARGWALRDAFADILRGFVADDIITEHAPHSQRQQAAAVDHIPPKIERLASHILGEKNTTHDDCQTTDIVPPQLHVAEAATECEPSDRVIMTQGELL